MEVTPAPAGAGDVLTIRLAGEALALPAGLVREVLRLQPLTRLPHAPASLLGLANCRGAVLPVVSLARVLHRPELAITAAARLVVLDGETPIGLLVDAVVALGAGGKPLAGLGDMLAEQFATAPSRTRRQVGGAAATEDAVAEVVAAERMLITCRLAGQDYAIALDQVAAVLRLPEAVTLVPQTDQAMLGVIPFRGWLLPLVSAHVLLGLRMDGLEQARARILVVHVGAMPVGLVVERNGAILRVLETAIDPVPPVLTRGTGEARIEAICRVDGGRRLLSLLSPARLFDEATVARLRAEACRETVMAETGTVNGAVERFLIFRLGEEEYGLPIAAVEEVARRPERLTRVPHAPAYLEGVMNLRGQVIPVIDQRHRFAAEGGPRGAGRIVIVTVNGLRAGFAVDAVTEVRAVPAAELAPAPQLAATALPVFDRVARLGRDGRMILLIAPQALLDAAERDLLADLATKTAAAVSAA